MAAVGAYGGTARLAAADAVALARRLPPAELAAKARRRLRNALVSEETVIELAKELADAAPPPPGRLTLAPVDAARLPLLHELNRRRAASRKTRRFIADLERGCAGFVALRDGRAAGYYWYAAGAAAAGHRDLTGRRGSVRPGPREVYGYDLFLLDDERGRNTAAELLGLVEHALAERGVERIWGYVDASNRPARWLYATRGYRATRRLTTRTVLGYRSTQQTAT